MTFPGGTIGIELFDAQKVKYSVQLYLKASSETTDTGLAQAAHIVNMFDTLTEAQILRASIHLPLTLSGVKGAPVAGSDMPVGALMELEVPLGREYSVWVPAWVRANFSGDAAIIPSAWSLDATSTYMTAGGSPPFLSDRYGNAVNAPVGAIKSIHDQRRNLVASRKR